MNNRLRNRFCLPSIMLGLLLYGAIPATAQARNVKLAWDANSEPNLAGYIMYFGIESRGCVLGPEDETFVYSGPQASQGASPIVIFLSDLEDTTNPTYTLYGLEDDTVYYFAVTAFNLSGRESLYSGEVPLEDVLGPVLCDASAPEETQVVLTFNEFVDIVRFTSTDIDNYSLVDDATNNPVTIFNIDYDYATYKKVTLNTGALTGGAIYTLTVNNVEDYWGGNPVIPNTQKDFTFTDAPHIRRVATAASLSSVEVEFSEDVDPVTVPDADNNYFIDNGISVNTAAMAVDRNLSDNNRTVVLTTSPHTEGTVYTLTVANVADTTGNVIAAIDDTVAYTAPQDLSPPVALSGHMTDSALNRSEVRVIFNEQVDPATANDTGNYFISGGITVNGAALSSDGRTVVLETSLHEYGDYQITVMGVEDTSAAGNSMVTTDLDYQVLDTGDFDEDGVINSLDNCTLVANEDQRDTDGDDYGNICDGDLDNDGVVSTPDLAIFRNALFTSDSPDADFDGDGFVSTPDLALFRFMLFQDPGPSGLVP